mmetsp:Transcript_20079/g.14800  ORF Transcript_20079/g.14800 Transcript_20079/m.14800 type:complete len:94 (-) Transcript_20079:2345-2626(-)
MSASLWELLKEAPGEQRYDYYSQMLTKWYLSNVTLTNRMICVYQETNAWSKRLSVETVQQSSRQLAKLASGNAVVVFHQLVNYAKEFSNMIQA